jgi:hypothetical protein
MKKLLFFVLVASSCLAEDKNYAIDASVGLSNAHALFYPVPSLSFYWLKSKGDHELSGEFYSRFKEYNDPNQTEENHFGFGLSYSFLFKLPIRQLLVGPTIGLVTYEYHKTTLEQNNTVYLGDENGIYLAGFKVAYFFGEKTIRFKIQERLLMGLRGDREIRGFGLFNTVNAGILLTL